MIVVACTSCAKSFRAPPEAVGHKVLCKGCGTEFVVAPAPAGSPSAPPPRPAVVPAAAPAVVPATAPSATMSLPVDAPAPAAAPPGHGSTRGPSAGSTDRPSGSAPLPSSDGSPASDLPARLGRFEVRGWVGEGTFAEVYQGYDRRLDREVALKVARPGTLGTDRRVKRFLREARAAGNLRHPNIVPLYETGEDAGRHFLVTAFIRGRTLGAVIDEGRSAGRPLDPREAATLARKLAGALAYAHGEGVVHRDFKPDNVMVDEKGEPLLMDFGLAARTDPEDGDERLTQQGVAVGTPAYMAPEQARGEGDIGPAADQYALGCTLYELLTGQTPFQGPSQVQLLLHQTKEAARPSRVCPGIPRDLDAICLKCLAKEPKDRYPSARGLVDDLDRFLRGEPVLARRQTLRYLAGKFVRRYRRSLAVAAAVLLLAVAGTVAAFFRINAERADAVAATGREQGERQKAEAALRDLEQSRKEAEVVWKVVEQAYTSVTEDNIRHLPGLSPVHEELAQIRLDGMQKLAVLTPDDPTVEPRVARAHLILGQISARVGGYERAKENLAKAGELYASLADRRDGDRGFRLLECRARIELARAHWDENRKAAARQSVQRALEWLEPELARTPDDPEVMYEVARGGALLGGCLPPRTPNADRLALADRTATLFQQLIDRSYREADSRAGLGVARYRQIVARFDGKSQDEHLKNLGTVQDLDEAALKLMPESPYVRGLFVFMGWDKADAYRTTGRFKECLAESEAAVARARAIYEQSPHDHNYPGLLASALGKFAHDLWRVGRVADAQAAFEEAVRIHETLMQRFPDRAFAVSQWIDRRNELADFFKNGTRSRDEILAKQNELRTLDGTIERGRALVARFKDHHWLQVNFAKTLKTRALYDSDAKRPAKALPFFLEAADIYRERVLPVRDRPDPEFDVPEYLDILQQASLCVAHKPEEAIRLGKLALEVRPECATRPAADSLGSLIVAAAKAHRAAGRFAEAVAAFQIAIEVRKPFFEAATWHWYLRANHGGTYMNLADTYRDMEDYRNEVLANREYLRLIIGPWWWGAKVDEFLAPGRPTDKAEADRIRDVIKAATKDGMKRFTIPADFSGIKYPFHVYVTNVPWPKHPLEDQARWVKEERGGTIPAEIMDSFSRLHKIAKENNVSYIDLCLYALGTAATDDAKGLTGKEFVIENLGDGAVPEATGKGARDPLADLKARLVDLKTKLDNTPGDVATVTEVVQVYREIGEKLVKMNQPREAVEYLRGAAFWYERLATVQPAVVAHRRQLADIFLVLGKAQVAIKEYDATYVSLHRRLELLEQLQADAPGPEQRADYADCHALLGELAELRGSRADAQRCYVRAVREGSARGGEKLVALLEVVPDFLALLPRDVAAAYEQARAKNPGVKGSGLSKAFTEAVAASSKNPKADAPATPLARLEDAAARYREAADGHRAGKRLPEFRAALAAEYQVRVALNSIEPKAPRLTAQRRVAGDLVASYVETKDTNLALQWYDRAGAEVTTETLAKLGEYVENGINTKADPKRAGQINYFVYYRRGKQLFRDGKYADALPELTKLCRAGGADAEDFNLLGMCEGKLGHWDEAIKAYQQSYALDRTQSDAVLNLMEAFVAADRPKDACEFAAGLDKKRWSPPAPHAPALARDLIVLNCLHAIAERLTTTEKGETPAERRMYDLYSVPGHDLGGWSWDELEGWFKKADLPDDKKAAVRRILDEVRGRAPERPTAHLPLAVGAKWVYAQHRPDDPKADLPDVVVTVAAREKVNGATCYRLESSAAGGRATSEHLAVRNNGVYRVAVDGKVLATPVRVLALPVAESEGWAVPPSADDKGVKLVARVVKELEVPAGKYKDVHHVREETGDAPAAVVRQAWYAEKVGPVRVEVTPTGEARVVRELRSYTPPKEGAVP